MQNKSVCVCVYVYCTVLYCSTVSALLHHAALLNIVLWTLHTHTNYNSTLSYRSSARTLVYDENGVHGVHIRMVGGWFTA